MEATKFVENPTGAPIFVAGRMIPPYDGRDIPVSALHQQAAEPVAEPVDHDAPLRALLELSLAGLKDKLPTLTREALDRLPELEDARDHPRKGVAEAVQAELLQRAQQEMDAEAKAKAEAAAAAAQAEAAGSTNAEQAEQEPGAEAEQG